MNKIKILLISFIVVLLSGCSTLKKLDELGASAVQQAIDSIDQSDSPTSSKQEALPAAKKEPVPVAKKNPVPVAKKEPVPVPVAKQEASQDTPSNRHFGAGDSKYDGINRQSLRAQDYHGVCSLRPKVSESFTKKEMKKTIWGDSYYQLVPKGLEANELKHHNFLRGCFYLIPNDENLRNNGSIDAFLIKGLKPNTLNAEKYSKHLSLNRTISPYSFPAYIHVNAYKRAYSHFYEAAKDGLADAQFNYAMMQLYGLGVPEADTDNLEESERWLKKQIIYWLKKASEQGHGPAQEVLAVVYPKGSSALQDEKMVLWYKKAAKLGYAPAQFMLAQFMLGGKGGPKDESKALKWFTVAAEKGFLPAAQRGR